MNMPPTDSRTPRAQCSIARRLAVMFALVALLVFALVGSGLFLVLCVQLEQHLRDSLDNRAEIARLIVTYVSNPDKWKLAHEKLADITSRDGSTMFAVTSNDGRYTYGDAARGPHHAAGDGGLRALSPARPRIRHADDHGHHSAQRRPSALAVIRRDRLFAERAYDARVRFRAWDSHRLCASRAMRRTLARTTVRSGSTRARCRSSSKT